MVSRKEGILSKAAEQQYNAKKDKISSELKQKLNAFFDELNPTGSDSNFIIFNKDKTPKEKTFVVAEMPRDIFEEVLPNEICDILFEENEKGCFTIIASKNPKVNGLDHDFSLIIMSDTNSEENKLDEAQAKCFSNSETNGHFAVASGRKLDRLLLFQDLNKQRYIALGLIEVARSLAEFSQII